MSAKKIINMCIGPLNFIGLDEPWINTSSIPEIKQEAFLRYMCPTVSSDTLGLAQRYKQISTEEKRLNVAPAEERILGKLIWPLRHAKAAYMVGNYLGTISLCGMVAEMVAIFLFEISNGSINKNNFSNKAQKLLSQNSFEKLRQCDRVRILSELDLICPDIKVAFDSIRKIRNRYLHIWSQDHEKLPPDAISVFKSAVSIVVEIIGQEFEDGCFKLDPAIIKYLERNGIYEPEENHSDE